jgi:hypothetical protein
MELTHLRSFYVIARERSVTRAATHLGLTQPALSIQIKALEAELGAALFARHRKQMQLTQAGEIFYRYVQTVLTTLEEAKTEVAELHQTGNAVHYISGFHRIRYYGLHATCKANKVKMKLTALMVALGRLIKGTYRIVAQKTYRDRVLASMGRDPLRCRRYGGEMMLWQVWHPRYGIVYDELQAIKRGRYGPCRGSPPGAGADGTGAKAMTQLALADLGV